jgi:hypothetical protein
LSNDEALTPFLIRNLGILSWFGTLRVLEKDKYQVQDQEREAAGAGTE